MFGAASIPGLSNGSPLAAPVSATPQGIGPSTLGNGNGVGLAPNATANMNNLPPRFFESPIGPMNNSIPNNFAGNRGGLGPNSFGPNVIQNLAQALQNQANETRLVQLEDENVERQNLNATLQQMGTQIVQGQKNILEQILEYQYIVQQCLDTLDHQDFVLSGQSEELALLRVRMEKYDYLIDAFKENKEQNRLAREKPNESTLANDTMARCRQLLSFRPRSTSPFSRGGATRGTVAKFQPLNLRHRPSNPNETRNITSAVPNPPATNSRLHRPPPSNNLNN